MRQTIFFVTVMGITALSAAHAAEGSDETSRAFQLARRVAALENEKELPSRAVWLGSRVARNARNLAFVQEEAPKPVKKARKVSSPQ